jgi:muramoyltetrapeptide carboxypeptidase
MRKSGSGGGGPRRASGETGRAVRCPRVLEPGDHVAVVSSSGYVLDRDELDRGLEVLRGWDLRPVLGASALTRHGHLAGDDVARAADVNAALGDSDVRGLFVTRGGFGSTRILDRIEWGELTDDPKPIVGYSDTTALLLTARERAGVASLHGAPVARLHGKGQHPSAAEHYRRLLFDSSYRPSVTGAASAVTIRGGRATGPLVGGNLAVICALLGTPWQPDLSGAVVLLEEVHERPYRIDRMLTQIGQAGVLADAAGIVLGAFVDCKPPPGRSSATWDELVDDRVAALGIPAVRNLPLGHVSDQLAVPIGAAVTLDADAASLTFDTPFMTG